MPRFCLIAASMLVAVPLAAQTSYAPPGDTLRFRETTVAEIKISTPQGEFPIKNEMKSSVAFTRVNADSARAWYEALSVSVSGPTGNQQPSADSVLNAPFALRFDNRGRTRLAAAPKIPASFEGYAELASQFDDFFLRLPQQPLRIGLTWTDTLARADSGSEKWRKWNTIASYRVERDTTVDGVRALVVAMKQQVRVHSEAPMQGQPVRLESKIEGTDEGFFVFAPQSGRLLGRRRQGNMVGDLVMRGGAGEFTMSQNFTFTNTLDAVKK